MLSPAFSGLHPVSSFSSSRTVRRTAHESGLCRPGIAVTLAACSRLGQVFFVLPLLVLSLATASQAASFDCAKATSKVEKMICADAELSKLDEEMVKIYHQAQKDLHNADWFSNQQRLWLKHRNICSDRDCLKNNYYWRLDNISWYVEIEKNSEQTVVGKNEAYTYELEVNNDDKVCRHMDQVYNAYFRQPWTVHGAESKQYGPDGLYSFPKYPGVEGFNLSMFGLGCSRRPSSPEFDAVPWRVALRFNKTSIDAPPISVCEQYRQEKVMGPGKGGKVCFYPLLITDFDIDNDGRVETVVKDSFQKNYPPLDHHSADHYYVFPQGTVDPWHFDYGPDYRAQYKKFGSWPRDITVFSARPFIFHGVSYLSQYTRWWKKDDFDMPVSPDTSDSRWWKDSDSGWDPDWPLDPGPADRSYMEVYIIRGSSKLISPGNQYAEAEYPMDLLCRFRMKYLDNK